jgi:hypothetical protein
MVFYHATPRSLVDQWPTSQTIVLLIMLITCILISGSSNSYLRSNYIHVINPLKTKRICFI